MRFQRIVGDELSPSDMEHFVELKKKYPIQFEQSYARFKCLMEPAESPLSKATPDTKLPLDRFLIDHPSEWTSSTSFIVTRDHSKLKNKSGAVVERFQEISPLCYMHAPVVLQHYLVQMTKKTVVPTIDIVLYCRNHLSAPILERQIWAGRGQNSLLFLEQILYNKPKDYITFFSHKLLKEEAYMAQCLRKYGPALVSEFLVMDEFMKIPGDWQHLGKAKGNIVGMHAMILVGYRKIGKTYRFLLQNWWIGKTYIEVDSIYLKSCGAIVRFVPQRQEEIGAFTTSDAQVMESDVDVEEESVAQLVWENAALH